MKEKDTYVWHSFCTIPEDISLYLAEVLNRAAGGQNHSLIYDGMIIFNDNYDENDLVNVLSKCMYNIFDIDLEYTIKDFCMPPFMNIILEHETKLEAQKTKLEAQEKELNQPRELLKKKNKLLEKQVFHNISTRNVSYAEEANWKIEKNDREVNKY
mgnify:CR=1 FL=1